MTLIKPSLIQLLVGVSLTGITAGLLYLLLGKDEDDVEELVQRIKTSRSATIEVKIPKDCVGVVIGRGGANIKEIQDKSETKINFKDEQPEENFRVCIIRGTPEAAQLAESLIHEFISNQPLIEVTTVLVPQNACGRIIGRNGENIRSISRASSAKITVESSSTNDKSCPAGPVRRVFIKGTSDQIEIAKALIQEKVEEDAEIRKKMESLNSRPPRGGKETVHYLTAGPEAQMVSNESPVENGDEKTVERRKRVKKLKRRLKKSDRKETNLKIKQDKVLMKVQSETDASEKLASVSSDGSVEVYVSAVSSPSTFWVQMYGPRAVDLDFLVEQMTDYYNKEENQELHAITSKLQENQMVAALFDVDKKWYRARVVKVNYDEYNPGDSEVDIYFVDYGDSEIVPQNQLLRLRTDFLQLRFQAIECSLANVQPKGDSWTPEAVDAFESLVHVARWVKLTARVQSYQEGKGLGTRATGLQAPCIDLFDSRGSQDISVAEEMVKQGFAVWRSESPRRSTSLTRSPRASASPSPISSRLSLLSDKVAGDSSSSSATLTQSSGSKEESNTVLNNETRLGATSEGKEETGNSVEKTRNEKEAFPTILKDQEDLPLNSNHSQPSLSRFGKEKFNQTFRHSKPTGNILPPEALSDFEDDEVDDTFDAP
ncbi:hypothetical protein R5R35_010127 [Gryllus longicercus]|uniref:Tudor domain-containing protein n=1 Tax=Gryllus longicercus TaxID=2509291 RepID=A0AAN9VDA2_9ORTH